MVNKPNKWVAALLGFVAPPMGMLYVAQLAWAGVYLSAGLAIGILNVFYRLAPVIDGVEIAVTLICAIHAYRLANRYSDEEPRPKYSRWYGLLGVALGLAAIAFGIRSFILEPFRFSSESMIPTINPGSFLIVKKWGYGGYGTYGVTHAPKSISAALNRADIIIFKYPPIKSSYYVQRLIGLPGDKIAYRGKRLFINGNEVPLHQVDDYLNSENFSHSPQFVESLMGVEYSIVMDKNKPPYNPTAPTFSFRHKCVYDSQGVTCEVPSGHYYVMGDNRDNSNDSRFWGFVPADHIIGKVIYIQP